MLGTEVVVHEFVGPGWLVDVGGQPIRVLGGSERHHDVAGQQCPEHRTADPVISPAMTQIPRWPLRSAEGAGPVARYGCRGPAVGHAGQG